MKRKQNSLYKLLLTAILAVFVLAACSSNSDTSKAPKEEKQESTEQETSSELSKENPIVVNEEEKTVQVYATVNGKYLVTPTRHGMNWVDGKYGNQAVLTTYSDPLVFSEALATIGGTPAVEKGGDASQEFEVTEEGKFIKGDKVNVSITWENADKEYDINEVMVDSTGKKLEYHYGGNYDAAAKMVTGCYMCFDSCPVGITSNASHPTGTFENGECRISWKSGCTSRGWNTCRVNLFLWGVRWYRMKFFIKATIHFIAAIFLYLLIGTALSTLMIQSKFIDMRFDSEFVITIAVLAGLWHYFARVFMNAHSLSLWEKKKASSLLAIISLAVILIIHFMNGSLSIMPAYMVRKALFMENMISLSGMNILLVVVLIVGIISLVVAQRSPLIVKSNPKMDWNKLPVSSRIGMMSFYLVYWDCFFFCISGRGQFETWLTVPSFI